MEFEKIKVSDLMKIAFSTCPKCGWTVHLFMSRWNDERVVASITCDDKDCGHCVSYEVIYDIVDSAEDFKGAMVNALDKALARYVKKAGRKKK